ncbi:holin-like protein [Anaerocolumna jejuensis DSM 15929]|uniref:Holin-like protein n=1 Tax=Anaerocolumna jejuensis DSM 15929 TaxID=1121322 RepID=A0A1M6SJK7_9FIRM|nr:CidA/LrgA family protein [Anaerocolumna jejuensis]SHK44954.1 holin-like protein [Anaerocolumna jejuensis DSM 15929]
MKLLKQFGIILIFTFLGEVCKYLIPLPIPASIYGLVLLLAALMTRVIQLEQLKEVSAFLIEIMPLMFIPASVGILNTWGVLKGIFIPIVIITVVTTVFVMVVTGRVTQLVIRMDKRRKS